MSRVRSTCVHMLAIVLGTLILLVASFTVLEQPAAEGTAPTILWTAPNPGGLAANMTTVA